MKKQRSLILSALAIFFFASCEIGLGSSVDTEAPSLEITNPPSDSVIRDDFAIQGTWTDDGSISSVTVDLTRLENNDKKHFDGTFTSPSDKNARGSWNIPINPREAGLLDGTYEAVVAIKDNGGHTTTMARSFTIDNTPPVMILQKPSTTIADADDRFDTFGQIFSIVGQAADDNSVEKIDVSVYSSPDCSDASFIKKVTLTNVPPTIDLNVAVFEENVDNDYSAIYGYTTKGNGAIPRYFKLEAYDNAKKYFADGTIDENGNKQTSYYLYKEISTLISDYKATGLYKIQSGTYSGAEGRTVSVSNVKETLSNASKAIGKFKLNPDNSPTFVVSARSPLAAGGSLDETAYQLTAGNNYLEVQINPGLDNNPIDEDSIGIYLRECEADGSPKSLTEESKIWLVQPKTDSETGVHAHDSDKVTITVSGDSYKFKTASLISNINYSGLQVDHFYRVYVAGHDNTKTEDNIVTDSNAIYGFKLITSGSFIELEVNPRQDFVTSNENTAGVTNPTEKNSITINLLYQGGASSYAVWEDNELLKDSTDTPIIISGPITNPITTKNGDTLTSTVVNGVFTTSIIKNRAALENYKTKNKSSIKYKVKGASINTETDQFVEGGAASSEKEVALEIDDTRPSVNDGLSVVYSDTNIVTHINTAYYGKQYLNVKGSCTEKNPETLYYYVKTPGSTESIPAYLHELADCAETSKFTRDTSDPENPNLYTFDLKGVEFDENTSAGGNTLYIQVKDKSGNLSAPQAFTFNIDTSEPELDARFFKFGTNASTLENTLYIKSGAQFTVYGKYEDSQSGVDGLTFKLGNSDVTSDVTVTYSTSETGTAASSIPADTSYHAYDSDNLPNKAEIKSWKAEFTPAATGRFVVSGVNKTGKHTSDVKIFDIVVDDDAPTVSNLRLIEVREGAEDKDAYSADGHYYVDNRNKTFKISGISTDNVGINLVELVVTNKDNSSQTATGTFDGLLGQWNFSAIDLSSFSGVETAPCSGATATLTIKDKAGNVATESLDIIFDRTAPKADHAIDDAQKDLVSRIGEGVGGKYSKGTYGNAFTMVVHGNYPDNAGGSGISKYYYKTFRREICFDENLTAENEPQEGSGENADKLYFISPETLKNYVIANKTDVFYPLTSVENNNVEYNILPTGTPANETNTTDRIGGGELVNNYTLDKGYVKFRKSIATNYKTTIGGFEEGKNYLVIVAEDNVGNTSIDYAEVQDGDGNTSTYYCYSINVDITAPDFVEVNADDFSSVHLTNGKQSKTVSFKVRDTESGIEDENSFTMKLGGTEISPVITLGEPDSSGYRLVNAEIPATALASISGYQTILVTATDAANNTSAPQSIGVINKDDTPPEVSFLTPEEDAEVNKIIKVTGKATEPNEVTAITLKAVCGSGDSAVTKEFEYPAPAADSGKGTITYANGQWSVTIDTIALDNSFSAGKELTLSLKAKDAAENETEDDDVVTRRLIINQNSDRPIITIGSGVNFTQKNGDEIWVKGSSTVYGSVIDDDGIAAGGFKIYRRAASATEAEASYTEASATYSGGSWNVRLPGDGSYVLKFEVKDKGIDASGAATGTIFRSAAITEASSDAEILATPIIQDSPETESDTANQLGATKAAGNTLLPVCLDTNPPLLTITGISVDNSTFYTDVNSPAIHLGGNYDTLYIRAEASDTSGLFGDTATSGVTASFSGSMTKDGVDYTITAGEGDCTVESSVSTENEFIITLTNFATAVNASADPASVPFSDTLTFTVTAKDKSGLETQKNFSRTVDNTAPVIKINAPESTITSTAVVTGSIEGELTNPAIYYTIKATNTQPAVDDSSWAEETHASLTYNVYFDGSTSATTTHAPLFKNYLWDLGITSEADVIAGTYTDFTTLYVWIKAVDNCGNISYKSAPVVVDPQGNRPTVTITYPDNNTTLGGTIRVMGTANDNIEARFAWLQIDINEHGSGDWDLEDYNILSAVTKSDDSPYYTFGKISTNQTLADAGITAPDATNISDIGIMVPVSGGSWYQNLNTRNELIPEGSTSNTIKINVYATDNDDGSTILKSNVASRSFTVDKDAPYFVQSSLKLVRYNAAGSVTAEQAYKEGMSVKGEWWLEGQIKDESSGISTITVTEGTEGTGAQLASVDSATTEITSGDYQFRRVSETNSSGETIYNYNLKIKVGAETGVGGKEFSIRVEENKLQGALSTSKSFMVRYDNQAPTLAPANADVFNINTSVKNSLGYYQLGSAAYERNSGDTGVERVAVYFTRTLDGVTYVYDPMYKRSASASRLTPIADDSASWTAGQIKKDIEDNLYWGKYSASSITSDTLSLSAAPASFVHAGGLAKVKGVVYRINSISGSSVVLSGEPGDTSSATDVYFAVANVVDNTSQESKPASPAYITDSDYGYGYCSNFTYDDDDMIMENLHKDDSTSWTWELWVNSKNIPDGDIDIHYVAFDKAGNSSHDSVTGATIENNKPRLVSVKIGLDVNQDETISEAAGAGEVSYYYPEGMAAKPAAYSLGVETINISNITVKGLMQVVPEVVGGNGDLYYRWKTKKTTEWQSVATKLMDGNNNYDDGNFSDTDDYISDGVLSTQTGTITHDIEWLIHNSTANSDDFFINYEIADSTEGKTRFAETASQASNKLSINITNINLLVRDEVAPVVTINPVYWNSRTDNSVYNQEGHIELPSDLPSTNFNVENTETSGEFDNDPKLSGKVKLTGSLTDNKLLTEVYATLPGMTGLSTATKVATYNKTQGKWKNADGTADFTTIGSLADEGYEFTILQNTNSFDVDNGHTVNWSLIWDTAKITNAAQTDVKLQIQAYDDAQNVGQTANLSHTASYKVDVVPYITGIETSFSKNLKSSIKGAYSRTALGHYIARKGESIRINGYNLGGTVTFEKENGTCSAVYASSGITIPDDAKSGVISIVVNGVETLNNKNDNNACGAYKTATTNITEDSLYAEKNAYAYNRMPNRTSNNLLTDDLEIDIWQFDSDAAVPRSGELREPIMSINPKTGKIGLAFVSGPGDFAMAGGLGDKYDADSNKDPSKDIYSYSLWQNNYATYNNIAFAYDDLGFAHATGTGLDTNPGSGSLHAGRFSYFYNRWGRSGSDTNGNYYGERAVRLESLAVPSWYRSDADFKTEMTTNTYPVVPEWTKTTKDFEASYLNNLAGQIPTATMYKLPIKGSIPETSSLTETRFFSPSIAATVHGSGDSATTAVYLAYYDSTQGQIRFRYSQEVPKTWVKGETTSTDGKTIQSTTFEKWSVDREKNVTVDGDYNEEYLTGAEIALDANGKFSGAGTFQSHMHHALNDKDDFVDNLGYFYKSKDYQAYMEANTDHFSLIAGTDYQLNSNGQKNEADFTVEDIPDRLIDADIVDNDGKALNDTVVRYRKTKIDKDAIVIEGNDYFKFKDVNGVKHLYKNNKDKAYIVEGEGTETKLKYNFTEDNPLYGQYTYQVADLATDTKAAAIRNYGYPVFVRIKGEDGKPVDSGTCEYLIPTIETVKIPVHQKQKYPSGYNTGYTAYKYVAIDAKAGTDAAHDTVVAVWYDGTNCRYAYNDNPTSGLDNGAADGWKNNQIIFTEGGEHCTVKLDSGGGVHIAAYVDGSLRYAHLDSPGANYTEATDSVKVDSFTITGERITLDVGKDSSGNVIPYISYFNGTARLPCVAKLVVPESGTMNYKAQGTGTDDGEDMFTGNWEISLVPSSKKLTTNYYDKMNICLWKQNGTIVRGNDENFTVSKTKTSADNLSGTTNGNIYGNGTANPILGYAIESNSGTCLETAQMK